MKPVYTLEDLQKGDFGALEKAPRLAVIGHPIAHSKSPQMHQAALDKAGLELSYIRVDLAPEQLADGVQQLRELGFIGCNITVPHKEAAYALADHIAPEAAALGVCNTLYFQADGIHGYSTDGPGFGQAVLEEFSLSLSDLKVMVLGAGGGAGRAIAHHCADESCQQLILVNRSVHKAESLADQLSPQLSDEFHLAGPSDRLIALGFDDPRLPELIEQAELIVNATSLGLKASDPSPLPRKFIEPQHLVYDTIYHETQLQRDARQRGARLATGQSMLMHQGALAYQIWLQEAPDLKTMAAALKDV